MTRPQAPTSLALDGLVVADPPEAWRSAGFAVDADGSCRVGGVRIALVGREAGSGIVGWTLRDPENTPDADIDGIPTTRSEAAVGTPGVHANGVTGIDHVVLLSPDVDRTVAAFVSLGTAPRREREGELGGRPIRQVFFRLGEVILEVVGSPDTAADGPSSLWGVTYEVADLDASAAHFGGRTSMVKPAVQPGRRITTLRHQEFGMSVRTAFLSPAAQ